MPPSGALGGLPIVSTGGPLDPISPAAGPSTSSGPLVTPSATLPGVSATLPGVSATPPGVSATPPGVSTAPPGVSVTATLANLLPLAASTVPPTPTGVYVGDGLAPVPPKLACRIRQWEYVDMGEMLPEFWMGKEEEAASKKGQSRRSRKVTDIFTWLQCYATYVSVLGPHAPEAIPELMAYMATIIRVSQDYQGLAWVRYDAGFRRQAALTGNRLWSRVNSTLYTVCFTGNAQTTTRCELCFGSTHSAKDCALQGDPDPEMQTRVKAVESALLAMTSKFGVRASGPPVSPSGQVCRLYNKGSCTYPRCRHSHVCSNCGGNHAAVSCPRYPHAVNQGMLPVNTRRPREGPKPF